METPLYELSFNYAGLIGLLILLFVELAIFFATKKIFDKLMLLKPATPIGTKEISPKVLMIFARIISGFFAVFALLFLISHFTYYREYKTRLDNDDVLRER